MRRSRSRLLAAAAVVGDIAGSCGNDSWSLDAGFLPGQGFESARVWTAGSSTVPVLGAGGTLAVDWVSDVTGLWEVRVDGEPVGSRESVEAGDTVHVEIPAADLPADGRCDVVIEVEEPSGERSGLTNRTYRDTSPPYVDSLGIRTVSGSLDPEVASWPPTLLVIGGSGEAQPVFLDGDDFEYSPPDGATEVTFESTNFAGRTTRVRIGLGAQGGGGTEGEFRGRSIFYFPDSELELAFEFHTETDTKPGAATRGVIVLVGDLTVNAHPIPEFTIPLSRAKVKKKAKANGRKMILKGKSARGAQPKVKFSMAAGSGAASSRSTR